MAEDKTIFLRDVRILVDKLQKTLKTKKHNHITMPKKCLICEDSAEFAIKNSNDYYCKECAEEQFNDISCLVPVEEANKTSEEAIDQLEELNKPEL